MKAAVVLVLAFLVAGPARAADSDAQIREALRSRVEDAHQGVGIVVGIVDAKDSRVVAYGTTQRDGGRAVDGDTVFELGSITKSFTALLLADMVARGEVGLHDPIAKYVPRSVKSPRAKDITLLQLARHTAGLPNMPDDFSFSDPANPFGDYSNEKLFAFLNGYKTRRTVGTHHSYSNYGAALLGEVLALRAGRDYETALRERILEPLGMRSTGIALTPALRAAHAHGHAPDGRTLALGGARGMQGSGALRSSVNDMVVFLEANLGLRETALAPAMRSTHATDADAQLPDLPMGLGWFHADIGGTRIVWNAGATVGSRSYIGMDIDAKRGVVVLSNASDPVGDLGVYLLKGWAMPPSASEPRQIK